MNKCIITIIVISLFLSAPASARTCQKYEDTTKIGKLINEKGFLVHTEFGVTKKRIKTNGTNIVSVEPLVSFPVEKPDQKTKGFRIFGIDQINNVEYSATAYIDIEEAENVIKALKHMTNKGDEWNGKDIGSQKITFSGSSGYTFSLTQQNDSTKPKQWWVVTFEYPVRIKIELTGADQFSTMADILTEGLSWLKNK